MKLTINSKILIGLLHFAAKNDVRYYLKGIYCEITGDDVILVATDGGVLGAFNCVEAAIFDDGERREDISFIVPRELLEGAKLSLKGECTIELKHEDPTISIRRITLRDSYSAIKVGGDEVDGKFPPWRRVIPQSVSGEVAQFDLELIARLAAASKAILNVRRLNVRRNAIIPLYLAHNGNSGALVSIGNDNFVGVLMPLNVSRVVNSIPTAPAWAI